jgi:protein ImuB
MVAVVPEAGPEAPLTHVSHAAYQARLRPGMRLAAARNLAPDLHVGIVAKEDVESETQALVHAMQTFSPRVEADTHFSGVFFLDPRGLARLYGGLRPWADVVHRFLRGRGLKSALVLGFERYRAVAVARGRKGVHVLDGPSEERALAEKTSLDRFELPAELRENLTLLGVRSLGDLLALPAGELHSRFGASASDLHGLFASDPQLPMQPHTLAEPVRVTLSVDPPDDHHERLLFALKGALHELVRGLSVRNEALSALHLTLSLEDGGTHRERLEPAAPTRDVVHLVELLRLRLANVTLPSRVDDVTLEAESTKPEAHQLRLTTSTADGVSHSDPTAAERVLARLRAAWGPRSVSRARLRDAHLPEAGFVWEAVDHVRQPRTPEPSSEVPSLVRRVLPRPKPLAPSPRSDGRSTPKLPDEEGKLLHLYGPYRVSGAWWAREVERDYYYAETEAGALLWLFYDHRRGRWFLHGFVD